MVPICRSVVSFRHSEEPKLAVDDILLIRVASIDEMGALCTILECPRLDAYMYVDHRLRGRRSARLRIGALYFARLRRIDPERGYADLGRTLKVSRKDKRELMITYVNRMMISLFSEDLAMLTFQPHDTIVSLLYLMGRHDSVYASLLELAWIPDRDMLQSPVLANVLNVIKEEQANERYVSLVNSSEFQMVLMKLAKFAFRAYLKRAKFCVHFRIRSPTGDIEAIKQALTSAKEFFKQRYDLPLEVVYYRASKYCLSFVAKSLAVAREMGALIGKHLQEILGDGDLLDSLESAYYSDSHTKDGVREDSDSDDEVEPKLNDFPPFFSDEGVTFILLVPYIFQQYFPDEFIDEFLVKSLVKEIINVATGCNNFSICRDTSYDSIFLDEPILRTLTWSQSDANETDTETYEA